MFFMFYDYRPNAPLSMFVIGALEMYYDDDTSGNTSCIIYNMYTHKSKCARGL